MARLSSCGGHRFPSVRPGRAILESEALPAHRFAPRSVLATDGRRGLVLRGSGPAVFIEMLPHSPDPAQDLQRLGLDPAMVSSSGTPINAPGSAASTLGFVDFVQHTSPLDTTLIYLEQPWRLVGMGDRGVSGMAILRADYIFSYPPSAGHPPNTAECRVCVLQSAWKWIFGAFPPFITLVTVVCVAVCWRRVWTRRRDARQAGLAVVGAFLWAQRHGTVLGGDVDGRCFRPDQAHGARELHDGTADRGDLLRDRRPAPPEHR